MELENRPENSETVFFRYWYDAPRSIDLPVQFITANSHGQKVAHNRIFSFLSD